MKYMIKVIVEINNKPIRTVMANRIGPRTAKPGGTNVYSVAAVDHETKKRVEFEVRHEYERGALRLAEKICGFAARKL